MGGGGGGVAHFRCRICDFFPLPLSQKLSSVLFTSTSLDLWFVESVLSLILFDIYVIFQHEDIVNLDPEFQNACQEDLSSEDKPCHQYMHQGQAKVIHDRRIIRTEVRTN